MGRRQWSLKQDEAVLRLVQKHGTKSWSLIAHQLSTIHKFRQRTGKQCRQRYHNHLDPKISKRSWTIDEQQIMFRMHKIHGNRWTIIAEQLNGRSDNTIKNHFYSTIRRSLRRMSKLVGQKNSTRQLKYIKPSTLSKIFAINTKPINLEEIEEEQKMCQQNHYYKKLVQFLSNECQQLTDIIMEFSVYKPKGKNCVLPEDKRGKFEAVLSKMEKLNQLYEDMRQQQRKLSALNKPIMIDSSSDQQSESQQQDSPLNSNQEDNKKTPHKKITRSQREIKPPKKFIQHLTTKPPIKKNEKSKPLLSGSQIQQQQKNKNSLMQVEEDVIGVDKQPEFQISLKDNIDEQQNSFIFPTPQLHLPPTPNYTLPTSFYINTPALQLYQTPPNVISTGSRGLFSHINGTWNIKNGQLDEMILSLGSQIAKNTSQNRQKDDGKTIISNINCSPNSAFKTCQ